MAQGNLQPTENPYDLAIEGRGFFRVRLPTGETGYTRSGAFSLNAAGEMVTPDGYLVEPGITIPDGTLKVTINAQGQVFAQVAGSTTDTNVGQFDLRNLCQRGGPRRPGFKHLPRDSSFRRSPGGNTRHRRRGHAAAGIA
jgi:flagellar basal-body rod protein FlgG